MGVYHAGSRTVQERVGVRERADHVGASIGEGIKPVAAAFLESQPLLIVGAADPSTGAVWASPLAGPPGFVRATGPRQMSVTEGSRRRTRSPRRWPPRVRWSAPSPSTRAPAAVCASTADSGPRNAGSR